jgi:4-aminobutyrate aminotransferase-like enzyme
MTRQTTMINAYTPGQGNLAPEDEARIARRMALLGPAYRLFYETPVHLVRGDGVWLYDRDGNAYLDTYNNVASVGHCHPRVVAAMADQAATLATHTRYLHDAVLDYAERLLALFPHPLTHVMFTCTGSEANDLALRIARARTGGQMWGFQRHGLIPDMVSLGKPMGNGYPMAGLVVQPDIVAAFGAKSRYFNTFGGNAVAASVGMAVLNVIRDEGLQANAQHTGTAFHQGLEDLATRHPCLGDTRSAGLFLGLDIIAEDGTPDPSRAARIVNALREARVLISATGPQGHILKIRPPLVFTTDHVALFLDRLEAALHAQ